MSFFGLIQNRLMEEEPVQHSTEIGRELKHKSSDCRQFPLILPTYPLIEKYVFTARNILWLFSFCLKS